MQPPFLIDPKLVSQLLFLSGSHECTPCQFCKDDADSVDGKCPSSCLLHTTRYGQRCAFHYDCVAGSFCSLLVGFEYMCLPCQLCIEPQEAVGGKCPSHCRLAALAEMELSQQLTLGQLPYGSTAYRDYMARQQEAERWEAAVRRQRQDKLFQIKVVVVIVMAVLAIALCAVHHYRDAYERRTQRLQASMRAEWDEMRRSMTATRTAEEPTVVAQRTGDNDCEDIDREGEASGEPGELGGDDGADGGGGLGVEVELVQVGDVSAPEGGEQEDGRGSVEGEGAIGEERPIGEEATGDCPP